MLLLLSEEETWLRDDQMTSLIVVHLLSTNFEFEIYSLEIMTRVPLYAIYFFLNYYNYREIKLAIFFMKNVFV